MDSIIYLNAPIFVWWDITYACNLKCKQCYSNSGQPAVNELTTKEAKILIDELAKLKIFYIYFLGGEPLLKKDFFEIAEYAHDSGIEVMMSTNGWFITPQVAKQLKKIGFMHVRVSLDGASEKTHDKIRGVKGSFQRAINALKILKDSGIPRIGTSPTVLPDNAEEIEELIHLAVELGLDEIQFVQLCRAGRGSNVQPITKEQLDLVRNIFQQYRQKLHGILHLTATEGIDMDFIEPVVDATLPDFWGCVGGRICAAIEAEGTVQPCILYKVSAGNIREKSFERIWKESRVFQQMRQSSINCLGCGYASLCSGPCPIESDLNGSLQKEFARKF